MIRLKEGQRFEYIEPNINEIPIRICPSRGVNFCRPGGMASQLHFHDEIEIISVIDGSMVFELADSSRYTVNSGSTVCVGKRVLHATYYGSDTISSMMIQFRTDLFENSQLHGFEKYIRRFGGTTPIVISDDASLFDFVKKICDEYNRRELGYEMYITSDVYGILGFLKRIGFLDSSAKFDSAKLEKLKPALEFVDENFASDITLEQVSETIGVSEYYFCRLFKSVFKSSFVDYLNFVRVSKADRLLRTTDKSVLEIALGTGFSSLSYFHRVFKKYRNCSPTVYRKAAREMY